MANFTPDELERYKEWAESLKGPQMSSLDEALEAQREAQAVAELTARGAKGAEKPLATLGEMSTGMPKATPTLSPAAQSAQVFQKAGELQGERTLSKKQIEDYVRGLSKPGKVAAESAEVLAGIPQTARESADVFKQAGELSSEKTLNKKQTEELVKKLSKSGKTAKESAKVFSQVSPAQISAEVFQEAGSALPKNIAEDVVRGASKAGKTAEESAKVLAPKELPVPSNYATTRERKLYDALIKQAEAETGTIGKNAIEMAGEVVPDEMPKNLPAVISNQNTVPAKLPTKTQTNLGDIIETTGRTIGSIPEPSRFSKLSKFLPSLQSLGKGATALGAAASAYDFSQGNLVEGGLTALETLLGNAAPRAAAPLELLRPTATVSQEEEQAELDALRRSNLLASLQKRGLAEESIGSGEQLALKRSRLDYDIPETPTPLLPDQKGYTVPSRPTPLLPESDQSMAAQGRASVSIPRELKPSSATGVPSQAEPSVAPAQTEQERKPTKDRLEEALEQQRQLELMAGISRGSEMLGRGIAGAIAKIQPSKMSGGEFEESLSRLGKQGVEGAKLIKERDDAQSKLDALERKRDPNSAESQMARDFFKNLNINIPENASYEALEKFSPQITKLFDQRENREQRMFLAQQAREARANKDTEKEKEATQELTRSFRKELNSGELGKLGTFARKAKSGVKLMEETIKDPSGYKDFAATFALLKTTQGDDSVIREAEMKLGLSLGSLPEKTKSKFIQFFTGEMRTPALRKEMLDTMKLLAKRAEEQYLSAADATLYNAQQYNIPRRLLLGQEFGGSPVEEKSEKRADVQAYADDHFKGDYNKAYNFLKDNGQL